MGAPEEALSGCIAIVEAVGALSEATGNLLMTKARGCLYVPGLERDDWTLPDPKGQYPERVLAIRDEIRTRVEGLIAARGWARPA